MALYLYTNEDQESILAHGLVLCTPEDAEDYLAHYRVGGEKKGHRRWQDASGRLTPEGYQHYAEMYGWNRKVKKAENLQNKADKKSEHAQNAEKRSEETVVKAYKAKQKNERHPSDRKQAKLDKLNAESERRKVASAQANLEAMKAQKKAVDYADKLQRKEDKMSKYVDEKGDLTEEALNKYAYATPNPGEKKMNLLGRIKFGNEYSNKFNKEHKMQMTKDEYKKWEEEETRKFNEASKREEDDFRLGRKMDKFDKLSDDEKSKVGQEVLDRVNSLDKKYGELNSEERLEADGLRDWLFNRIDSKSGNWNVGEFHKGTRGEKAYKEYDDASDKAYERRTEIEKEIGYNSNAKSDRQRSKEYERLKSALKSDSLYQALSENYKKAESDLCGAVLKDMGFADTPANRSMIFEYVFLD